MKSKSLEDAPIDETHFTRRGFIRIAGIGLAAPALLTQCTTDETEPEPEVISPGEAFFPQSVASGDPRPDAIVLWTRVSDGDPAAGIGLRLDLATDPAFTTLVGQKDLLATADHDFVVKVRLTGLTAGTTYYYRFVYTKDGSKFASRTGRTKTAPPADADTPVKFAFVSCQDYVGRYFNSFIKMLEQADELDFLVHLGDYVYETTGDPNFQSQGGERNIVFSDTAGAIAFTDANNDITHYAAASLSNYRELYKTYRTDEYLQRIHELVPFVCIWDDHEFADDCWGDNATYFDGKLDEDGELDRRKAAEQAYFEFLPTELGLDTAGEGFDIGDKLPVSDAGTVLYRDFRFGQHLHLVMTDTRSYRPDHAIAEDAFWGAVALDATELTGAGVDPEALDGANNPIYAPYVDIDDAAYAQHKTLLLAALAAAYVTAGLDATYAAAKAALRVTGLLSVASVNDLLAADIANNVVAAIDPTGLPKGMTIDHMRFQKKKLFSTDGIGARYLVDEQYFKLWRRVKYAAAAASQDVMGPVQEQWLLDTLQGSTATWKIVGSSISFSAMIIDVSDAAFPPSLEGLPDSADIHAGANLFKAFFNAPYLFSVDQWDGFPDKQEGLLDAMREVENTVVISGDIHSSYVTNHGTGVGGTYPVFEFTGAAISSESFKGFVYAKVDAVFPGASTSASVIALVSHLEEFLKFKNPRMVYASNETIGYTTLEVQASGITAVYYQALEEHASNDYSGGEDAAAAPYTTRTFTIAGGTISET